MTKLFIFFTTIFIARSVFGGMVINEVLSNVEGRDSGAGSPGDRNEFIELYNNSEDSIDICGWWIGSGKYFPVLDSTIPWQSPFPDTNVIIGTTIIPPNGFGVILDPEYTETGDGIFNQPYQFGDGCVILTIHTKAFGYTGLASTHSVWLIDGSENLIDTYGTPTDSTDSIPFDPTDGVSVERVNPDESDFYLNWKPSRAPEGCTPGKRNSVSLRWDLSVDDLSLEPSVLQITDTLKIHLTIKNIGSDPAFDFEILVFHDENLDGVIQTLETILDTVVKDTLEPESLYSIEAEWSELEEGEFRIYAEIHWSLDEDTSNNKTYRTVRIGAPPPSIVINEIMHSPKSGESEWIELYNRVGEAINLDGWKISDKNKSYDLTNLSLNPDEYAIITEDSSTFNYNVDCKVVEPDGGFPTLSKDDSVFILDETDFEVDGVRYSSSWGGEKGISLERINPDLLSDDRSNWGSSVAITGATPGIKNSIYVKVVPSNVSIFCSPTPFSPDGDGRDDYTIISYNLPFKFAKVKLYIYDVHGRLVKKLLEQKESGSAHSIIWDGRDESDNILTTGIYIVYLEAVDRDSENVSRSKTTVILAKRR